MLAGKKPRKKDTKKTADARGVGPKRIHAYTYIDDVAHSEILDRTAFLGHENDFYLPYRAVLFFFGEYEYYCEKHFIPEHECASESTFRRAFDMVKRDLKDRENITLKLSGGKGVLFIFIFCHCHVIIIIELLYRIV